MNRRREPCRNFQCGSCHFGDRCKFLHNVSQSKDASNFGGKYQSQPQPFENKWTRSSATATAKPKPSERTDTQPNVVIHKCTDPESCKRQIVEDFKQERPLWKLTCYGHSKSHPCDIVGDISYEELCATAYEDARRGLALESIVERERNLLNSKLIEFNNLLQNPYTISQNPGSAGPSPFHAICNKPSSTAAQSNALPSVSSFSQPGASANLGPSISTFGQPNPFQIPSRTSSGIELKFGASGLPSGPSPLSFGTSGPQNVPSFNYDVMATQSNTFSQPPVQSAQFSSGTTNLSPAFFDGNRFVGHTVEQASLDTISLDKERELNPEAYSIWLKEEWKIGEIPEDEPPARLCL